MMQETDNRNFKEKAQMKWNELVYKAQRTKDWMVQHPTETVAIITLGVGVIAEGELEIIVYGTLYANILSAVLINMRSGKQRR